MDKEPSNPEPSDHSTPRLAFVTLALCFLLMALGRGASETFTVFLLPISNTFGWDRAQTVSVYSIGALCVGSSTTQDRAPSTPSASSCSAQDFQPGPLHSRYGSCSSALALRWASAPRAS